MSQFLFDSDEALDRFIDEFATDMEAEALETFGDTIAWNERILREDTTRELPAGEMPECLNCGTHLRGQYCGNCGQRARSRLISLWELVRDAFGDLFELDSRLWKTLLPLLARPGRLTHDYLQGRRARYMPPFRMYLVLSLLFFLVAFFNPRESFRVFYEPQVTEDARSSAEQPDAKQEESAPSELPPEAREVLDEVAAEGLIRDEESSEDNGINIRIDDDGSTPTGCEMEDFSINGPPWLQRRLTRERAQRILRTSQTR